MELRQLRYFLAVSRLGSVTRAAEQCHIAQPAISVAIRNLEEELGVQLFERYHKRISLTPAGAVFLRRGEDILNRVDSAIKEMEDFADLRRGVIRVGITPMLGAVVFPYVLSKFRADHPALELIVVEEGALTIESLLEQGELDVALMFVPETPPELAVSPILRSEIHVCMSPDNPLSERGRIAFPKLKDEPFILFKENFLSRRLVLQECARHQMTPNIVFSSNQIATIISLIERGVGIGFLLEHLAQGKPRIKALRLAKPLYLEASLVWNKSRYLSQSVQAFIDAIRSYPLKGDMA